MYPGQAAAVEAMPSAPRGSPGLSGPAGPAGPYVINLFLQFERGEGVFLSSSSDMPTNEAMKTVQLKTAHKNLV